MSLCLFDTPPAQAHSPTSQAAARAIRPDVEYRLLKDWPGYRVGSDGSVWSCRLNSGRLVNIWRRRKVWRHRRGHLYVRVYHKGTVVKFGCHQLVLLAFVGPCPPGMECCHNDGNPANNAVENLRWDTRKANALDRYSHGTHNKGEMHNLAVLTDEVVAQARTERIRDKTPYPQLAAKYGVKRTAMRYAITGVTWKHVTENVAPVEKRNAV